MQFYELQNRLLLVEAPEARALYIQQHYPAVAPLIPDILQTDPTANKELSVWIAKQLAGGRIALPEDEQQVYNALATFEKLKRNGDLRGGDSDVMRYASFDDLRRAIGEYETQAEQSAEQKVEGTVSIAKEGPFDVRLVTNGKLLAPRVCKLGWCVKDPKWMSRYTRQPPLLLWLKDGKPWALLHPKTQQFNDIHNHSLEWGYGGLSTKEREIVRRLRSQAETDWSKYMPTQEDRPENAVSIAARQYLDRRDRLEHPNGKFDKSGRWYPAQDERQTCCSQIREPSRSYPYSYMLHCRTVDHVAHLHNVDPKAVRKRAREIEKQG